MCVRRELESRTASGGLAMDNLVGGVARQTVGVDAYEGLLRDNLVRSPTVVVVGLF